MGGRVPGAALLLLIPVPCVCLLLTRLTSSKLPLMAAGISLGAGAAVLLFLAVLLMVGLRQDRKIARYYDAHRNLRLPLENGLYECAACGCRRIRREDRSCIVCGVRFSEERDRTAEEILKG